MSGVQELLQHKIIGPPKFVPEVLLVKSDFVSDIVKFVAND